VGEIEKDSAMGLLVNDGKIYVYYNKYLKNLINLMRTIVLPIMTTKFVIYDREFYYFLEKYNNKNFYFEKGLNYFVLKNQNNFVHISSHTVADYYLQILFYIQSNIIKTPPALFNTKMLENNLDKLRVIVKYKRMIYGVNDVEITEIRHPVLDQFFKGKYYLDLMSRPNDDTRFFKSLKRVKGSSMGGGKDFFSGYKVLFKGLVNDMNKYKIQIPIDFQDIMHIKRRYERRLNILSKMIGYAVYTKESQDVFTQQFLEARRKGVKEKKEKEIKKQKEDIEILEIRKKEKELRIAKEKKTKELIEEKKRLKTEIDDIKKKKKKESTFFNLKNKLKRDKDSFKNRKKKLNEKYKTQIDSIVKRIGILAQKMYKNDTSIQSKLSRIRNQPIPNYQILYNLKKLFLDLQIKEKRHTKTTLTKEFINNYKSFIVKEREYLKKIREKKKAAFQKLGGESKEYISLNKEYMYIINYTINNIKIYENFLRDFEKNK
jgi:hypothetical protein